MIIAIVLIFLVVACGLVWLAIRRMFPPSDVLTEIITNNEAPGSPNTNALLEGQEASDDDALPEGFFAEEKGVHVAKKALIIGINAYPDSPLRGCVNDANDALTYIGTNGKVYSHGGGGFSEKEIAIAVKALSAQGYEVRMLLNKKATSANIKAGYAWLLANTIEGDKRLFWYSGHGTQLDDPREADGYSEALCPVNLDFDRLDTFVTDDDLYNGYTTLTSGVNLTFVLDCCHAWDNDRSPRKPRSRFLPPPPSKVQRSKAVSTIAGRTNQHDSVVVIGGCRADQTSADAVYPDATGKKRYNGALSYNLLKTLRAIPNEPLTSIIADVQANVKAQGYDQVPQLLGSERLKLKPFLG